MQGEIDQLIEQLESIKKKVEELKQKLQGEKIPTDEYVLLLEAKISGLSKELNERVRPLENAGKLSEQWKMEIKRPKYCISACWTLAVLLAIWWIAYGFASRVSELIKCECTPSA